MKLAQIKEDKENLEADIRLSLLDYFEKYPDHDVEVIIKKEYTTLDAYENRLLPFIDVKVKLTINL